MAKRVKVVLFSIGLGVLLTVFSVFVPESVDRRWNWNMQGNCSRTTDGLPATVRRVDCSGKEYGLPLKFIYSEPKLDITFLEPSEVSPLMLGVVSEIKLHWTKLTADVVFWSVLTYAILKIAYLRKAKTAKDDKKTEKSSD